MCYTLRSQATEPGFGNEESEMAMLHRFLNDRARVKSVTVLGVLGLAVSLAACDRGKESDKAKQAAAAPPPPAVMVAEVVQRTVPIYGEFVAQTDAKETVEIRARVQAFLDAQHFTEGTIVKKDQLLFTLDKREYEAKLLQAKSQLEGALARLGKAETDERRLKPLAERRAVPQQDYDNAAANLDTARAGVSAARADVVGAELDLSYCTIRSPIKGLIGKRLVAPGNLVGKGEATLLDTVSSIDPIRVNATISEAEYLRFFGKQQSGARTSAGAVLELILADGGVFPHKGKLVIVDRAVDMKTGTLTIVAEFPNSEGRLRPGQFGRVRAPVEVAENAILIPKRAVQEIQGMKSVLVVGADNMVALRTIRPGETVGPMLIVLDGVKPGERVIVEGIQKAKPGTKVNPSVAPAESIGAKAAGKAQGTPVAPAPAKTGGEMIRGPVLHPPSDRRDRHRDPDCHAWRGHHRRAVGRAVSVPRAAQHPRDRDLSRRVGRGGRAIGGDPDRAGGQRCGPAHLHEVVEHQRRPDATRRQLRGRHRPGHRQRPDAEPRFGGAGAPAGGSHAAGRHRQEAEPQHPDGDLDLLARGRLRRQLPDQLCRHQPARPAAAHSRDCAGGPLRWHRLRDADLVQPDKLAKLGLVPADVINAIKEQNLQAPSGKVGAAPTPKDQEFTNTVSAPGRLVTPEEFENVIVRQSETGAVVRIKDIGRAELGSQDYNAFGRLNGKPAGAMAVYLLPGANQLKAAETIYATMERAKELFPPGMDYKIVYDTTPAVQASIHEILKTFVEALILVTLVVFIFLQNIRATDHPAADDSGLPNRHLHLLPASRVLRQHAVDVRPGARHRDRGGRRHRRGRGGHPPPRAWDESKGGDRQGDGGGHRAGHRHRADPLRGVRPVAMLGGLVGSMYKQFALTIAISVLLSAFNALSLTPALCAMLLREPKPMRGPLGAFFRGFNKVFDATTAGYVSVSRLLVRRALLTIAIVAAVAIVASLFARVLPAGFIPDEDQGIFGVNVQLPPGASLERTSGVLKQIEDILAKTDGLDSFQTVGGYGAVTSTYQPNYGTIFVRLKPWEERKSAALHVNGIMGGLQQAVRGDSRGDHLPVQHSDAVRVRGRVGVQFPAPGPQRLADSIEQLGEQAQKFLAAARQRPELGTVFTSFDPNYPQVKVELDREKARTLGVPVNEVFQALSATLGGSYVNDFNRFGRLYRVYVQADAAARLKAEDIGKIYVRSKTTSVMVPLSTLVTDHAISPAAS